MKFMPEAVSKAIARQALIAEKHSPALLFGTGIVGMIGSTVLACRATLKSQYILEQAADDLEAAKSLEHRLYTESEIETERKHEVSIIYVRTATKIGRLYAPAVVLGGASVAALARSHNILNRRNAALTAAYAALDRGFAEYRQRVIDKYGEEEDRHLRYGAREVKVISEETGKTSTVLRVSDEEPSVYARFFDPLSTSWQKEPEYNLIFLRCQQNFANDLLRARGHVFLNEVYDMLGIPRSKAGSVVGWIMSREGTDNYIDLGIFTGDDHNVRDFVNGREGSILLDFNVDGVIFDKIDTPREALSWQLSS